MIHITICGHDSHHPASFVMEHSGGLPDYLLLLVKTDAWFDLGKVRTATAPNMAILFDKNTYIRYGCDHPHYNDDWIHFDFSSREDDFLTRELHIPLGQPLYLPQLHALSRQIQTMTPVFHSSCLHREKLLDSMMRTLLYSLDEQLLSAQSGRPSGKHYDAFQKLRAELYNNPGHPWTIAEMSASLFLSTSYFQHLYKEFFQCSCQQDIIRARLELAKFHLATSNFSIRSLSRFCGYENELHFMRQFKKFEGLTPSEFRKSAQRGRPE